ncbi:DegT/DnrJ/EryC1/StrS family aminotransferase [Bryobacter aggregatus]|uniref:DegT/DnrJ/EryC1/StrS family aminotransferase n=1 Tax=Bryobacter aggregatus TaxID=360054 RepID=UPI0004E13F46|nr:DegT/DnrJ/EryC1/StrS family aminotransferase [Bryobacter aggregatus]
MNNATVAAQRSVPFFRPSVGEAEKTAVLKVLEGGWLTTGKKTKEFEERFAASVGAKYAVALNSCTAALHLALEAIGLAPGDQVLVPNMTFAATAEVVRYFGAKPVLVDCEAETLCLDPQQAYSAARRAQASGPLKAILPMHYGGQMADMDAMHALGAEFGIPVIEDAAHTLPAYRRDAAGEWRPVGHGSSAACFSFYANKCITTGEGGMATTNDEALADRMRMMSLHGLSRSAWNRFESKGSWYYEIVAPGFKYNLTDVAGALGVAQLGRSEEFWQARRRIASLYREQLSEVAEIEVPAEREDCQSSWHLFSTRLHLDRLTIDRARFIEEMKEHGITCSVHWMPLHLHPYYRETYGFAPEEYPVANALWPRLVSLPIFPSMTDEEVEIVVSAVRTICAENRA